MADGILYCFNLNLSMDFRVGSRTPIICRKLYVATVNNSFQTLPIFCHKELHLSGHIRFDLIVKLMEFDHVFSEIRE